MLVAGFLLVRAGSLSIGGATAGALLFVRLSTSSTSCSAPSTTRSARSPRWRGWSGVAAVEPPPDPAAPPRPRRLRRASRGVRHAYAAGHVVLHDVDLDLAPGEHVALVGVSGAGKTTLAKIVAGFHAPTAGTVRSGRRSPRSVRRHAAAVALVTQEVHVFAGPLADDLRLAAPAAGDDELEAALALVGALDWVRALPGGLATPVGAGGVGAHAPRRRSSSRSRASPSPIRRSRCSTRRRRRRAAPAPACSRPRRTACSPGAPRSSSPTG